MKKKRRVSKDKRKFLSQSLVILVILLVIVLYLLFNQLKQLEFAGELRSLGIVSADDDVNTTSIIDVSINNNINKEVNFTHLSVSNIVPYSHLIFYMSFDENDDSDNVYDYNGNIDGVVNGDPVFANCIYDNCYEFDGKEDFIEFGENDFDFGDEPFTISLWVKGNGSGQGIITKDDWSGLGNGIKIFTNDNDDGHYAYWNGSETTIIGKRNDSWHHLAITRRIVEDSAGNIKLLNVSLYYDGQFMDSTTDGRTLSNSKKFRIGNMNDNVGFFNGSIDEVMIFSGSLTDNQIENIYENQSIRFEEEGIITLRQFDYIETGSNVVDVATDRYENSFGSSLDLRIADWAPVDGYDDDKNSGQNNGLRGYWHADENINDVSGNGNDGSGNGSFEYAAGVWDRAFKFDGKDDFVYIGDDGDLDVTGNITLSVWIYQDELSTGVIAAKGVSTSDRNFEFSVVDDGTIKFCNDANCHSSSEVLREGIWDHLVVTFNEKNKIYYHNGVLISNIISESDLNSDGGNLLIGAFDESFFNGSIDEFMIFARALEIEEVEKLYVQGRANYNFKDYQPVDGSNRFDISEDSTNLLVEYKFNAGIDGFYTPLLFTGIHFDYSFDDDDDDDLISFVDDGVVDIVTPSNGSRSNNNFLDVNYIVNYTNISSCWYSNGTFRVNVTLPNCENITDLTWRNGDHEVRIYANSSDGNLSGSRVFFTIRSNGTRFIDTTRRTDFNQSDIPTDAPPIDLGIGEAIESDESDEKIDPSVLIYYLIIGILLVLIFIVIFLLIKASKSRGIIGG